MKLLQGDCLELMKDIDDKSIDMILCDLPYGTTQNKWDSIISLESLWKQYERIIKSKGVIVLNAQCPFDKILGASRIDLLKYEWIWEKTHATGHLNAKKMPMKSHENILIFYQNTPTYNPQMRDGEPYKRTPSGRHSTNYGSQVKVFSESLDGKRYPISNIIFQGDRGLHPTQKPVALMEYLIKTYTNENDLVLDNCMGSGTTGVACKNLNRDFIGIEKDKEYFEIAKERILANI